MTQIPQILSTDTDPAGASCDALVLPLGSEDGKALLVGPTAEVDAELGGALTELVSNGATGRPGEVISVPTLGRLPARTLILVGIGSGPSEETFRAAAAGAGRKLGGANDTISFLHVGADERALATSIEGFVLALYRFDGYRSDPPSERSRRISFAGASTAVLDHTIARLEAQYLARDLANEPASVLTPTEFARRAQQVADVAGLEIQVLDRDRLERDGFGGILAVGKGSPEPPCLVIVRYEPDEPSERVAIVGKGITFDSGGYSIKPSTSMEMMKTDMAGAGAVLAAMGALKRLNIKSSVTAYLACAENMISGAAMRPGDVITHYGGRTTEVTNTDAEGRLVLGDALALASEEDPNAIVDIATLTGGIHIALGDDIAGLFTADDHLANELEAAASEAGEPIWRMPIVDRYAKSLESSSADMRNSGSRWGGAISATLFLRRFVAPGIPWAHLDIAGPARSDSERDEHNKGGTGFGTKLLLGWLEKRAAGS